MHSTHGCKRSSLPRTRRSVVHGKSTRLARIPTIRDLWDPFVSPVSGFEIQVCGPVVGEVFGEDAGCAVGELGDVG